jgi:hypothetical protein
MAGILLFCLILTYILQNSELSSLVDMKRGKISQKGDKNGRRIYGKSKISKRKV